MEAVQHEASHKDLDQSQRINDTTYGDSVELSNLPLVQLSRNSVLALPVLQENKYTYIRLCL